MSKIPELNRKHQADWYSRNADKKKQMRKDRLRAVKAMLDEKKSVPCTDCGEKFPPYVMDFDHVRGVKLFSLSRGWNRSDKMILEEIEKCEVVCANCHRIRTNTRAISSAESEQAVSTR